MFSNRRLVRFVLFAGLVFFAAQISAQQASDAADCFDSKTAAIWTSPLQAAAGRPLNIMAVSSEARLENLSAFGPDGQEISLNIVQRGGPPWSLSAEFVPSRNGRYRIEVHREGKPVSSRVVAVGGPAERAPVADWNRTAEAFYSAWIERLFDAPAEESLSFSSMEPIMRDPKRNFLHNYLGKHEDERLPATPDCADLPYFLRAYFAWKMALPIAFRECDRGTSKRAPLCGAPIIDERLETEGVSQDSVAKLIRQINDTVHSGSLRTALDAEASDFYPIPLKREYLWPGTVFADPYGHTLMIVKWIPQTAEQSGLLLAVDAQPDNSVGRKRFWEGNFLFTSDENSGAGFKAFRPVIRDQNGRPRLASNASLSLNAPLAPYSDAQGKLSPEDFYASMGQLINPRGLAPEEAYEAVLDALLEQLETRVRSVENGEAYTRRHPGIIPMPKGAAIFQTVGPWEDYSTPSRDLRLLIAIDVLLRMPERIVRYPGLFALNGQSPEAARQNVRQLHARRIEARRFIYTRSDGSPQELSVADVLRRLPDLEVAYNPNDCAEVRWGAPPGSNEYAPCSRRAPREQQARMEQYREWFHERRRPSR